MLREKRRREKAVNRDFCRAAHKGCKQDRHGPVALRWKRPGRHDGGHRTAEADEHRHDGLTGKTDAPQQLVHHKRHACHIAGVFQNRQKEKERHDHGQEAQNASHTLKNTVDDQAQHHGIEPVSCERRIGKRCELVNAERQKIAQKRADHMERQKENEKHHADKNRDRRIFAGQNFICLHASSVLPTLPGLHDGLAHEFFNEAVAHVGKCCVPVQAPLLLHLQNRVLNELLFVLVELERIFDAAVSFNKPRRGKARVDARRLRVVFDLVADRMDAPVHGARLTEVVDLRQNFPLRHPNGFVNEFRHAVGRRRADRNDRNAERLCHFLHVDTAAVSGQLVHHVERQNRRHAQRQKL